MKGAARGAAFDMKGIPAAARSCASGQRGGGLCGGRTVPRGEKVLGETPPHMLPAREAHTPATSAPIAAGGASLSAREDDGDTSLHKAAAPAP